MDHTGHHVEQLQNGVLDHAYQLQERGHDTEGDGAVTQADAAPYECQEITQSEDTAHDDSGENGKAQALDDISLQALLHGVEPLGDPLFTAQRAQHGIVLHTFLYLHLDTALVLTDVEGHLSQAAGNEFAKDDGEGRQQQQGPRQTGVEPSHEHERTGQLNDRDNHLRQRVGTDGAHLFDVLRQS